MPKREYMKSAPKPKNEQQRLESLNSLNILDTLPESNFDQITFLASQICGTPIALISLVDENRQWFKSKVGLDATETHRDLAFCAHAILDKNVFEVPDSSKDSRFSDNPLATGSPHVQFYAGAPIITPDGFPIGTVCVIDTRPRQLEARQIEALKALSDQVTRLLALRSQVVELNKSKSDLRFVLDSIPNMVGLWSADEINLDSNSEYYKYFKKYPDQIRGRHMKELLGEELYKENLPYIQRVLSGEQVMFEQKLQQVDGSKHQTLVHYIPNFKENKVVSFLAMIVDITELKKLQGEQHKLETRLAESAKLSALGEMAAGVAHEVNNPLAIIKGRIELIFQKNIQKNLNLDPIFKDLKIIDSTVDRITKIVKALKSYSRNAESDATENANLSEIVGDTLELCRERFKNAGIDIRLNFEPELVIDCRPSQISQVIMNLLGNSFDAILNLDTKWIELKGFRRAGTIHFAVTDSGFGIPKATVEKMMNPFFTTKEIGKGTGLGLSISTGIIELHGGKLKYSEGLAHTTFEITLPESIQKAKSIAS